MTRHATLEQMASAREAAEIAIGIGADRNMWPTLLLRFKTEGELEAFRVALLLKGKDTRYQRAPRSKNARMSSPVGAMKPASSGAAAAPSWVRIESREKCALQ